MNYYRSVLLFLGLALAVSGPTLADVLLIESIQSSPTMQTPRKGLNMAMVRQQFGEPAQQVAAVGEPPISRWEYSGFTVYFEDDLVLHSVIQHATNN